MPGILPRDRPQGSSLSERLQAPQHRNRFLNACPQYIYIYIYMYIYIYVILGVEFYIQIDTQVVNQKRNVLDVLK